MFLQMLPSCHDIGTFDQFDSLMLIQDRIMTHLAKQLLAPFDRMGRDTAPDGETLVRDRIMTHLVKQLLAVCLLIRTRATALLSLLCCSQHTNAGFRLPICTPVLR